MRFLRHAAAQYAMIWALNRNSKYPDYSFENGGGGDCTNFVSQAMYAGGWPMTVQGGKSTLSNVVRGIGWLSSDESSSDAWCNASAFADFIEESRRAKVCKREELDVGDLVTHNPYGKRINHVMIITGKKHGPSGEIDLLFCGHTSDRLNFSLALAESRTNMIFRYWKVADVFKW